MIGHHRTKSRGRLIVMVVVRGQACKQDPGLMVHVLRAAINEVIGSESMVHAKCRDNDNNTATKIYIYTIYVVRLVPASSTTRTQSSP